MLNTKSLSQLLTEKQRLFGFTVSEDEDFVYFYLKDEKLAAWNSSRFDFTAKLDMQSIADRRMETDMHLFDFEPSETIHEMRLQYQEARGE